MCLEASHGVVRLLFIWGPWAHASMSPAIESPAVDAGFGDSGHGAFTPKSRGIAKRIQGSTVSIEGRRAARIGAGS